MTFGLMVLAINIGYLIFSIIAGIVLAKLLKKSAWFHKRSTALLSIVLSLLIFLAPFYDLLIQKGIKTYYQTFKMDEQIFAYPKRDSEGRVESLGMDKNCTVSSSGYLSTNKKFKYFQQDYPVDKFVEIYMKGSFFIKDGKVTENTKNDMGYTRVYLDKPSIAYDKIESTKDFKARYQVLAQVKKHYFYTEKIVSFWDKKKNKLLAKGMEITFPVKDEESKFRYYLLHWHGANGRGVNIQYLENYNLISKKLFGFILQSWK